MTDSPFKNTFDAADDFHRAIADWRVASNALDADLRDKEKIEARIYDLYRNNDLFRGLVEKQVDTIVGSKMILQCKPDYEALGATVDEAKAWCKTVEREWHKYADSPENWITADRSMDFTQLCRAATRSKIFTGEILASREWRRSPLQYHTCFNLVTTDRLKTPKQGRYGDELVRDIFHGIEFDRYGAATAYHIKRFKRKGGKSFDVIDNNENETKRYLRYNRLGHLQIFHIYEPFKSEYPRGISRAASILKKIKQLDRFLQADLDKAIALACFVLVITSDETPEDVARMLSGMSQFENAGGAFAVGGDDTGGCDPKTPIELEAKQKYDDLMKELCDRYIEFSNGQWMHAFNGEKVEILGAPTNHGTPADYAKGHTKSIANGMGMSYELGTGDFDGISFSGGQMSLGIYEHSANIERKVYIHKFARLCFRSWLPEAMDRGLVPMLGNKTYFEDQEAYSQCEFSGAKRVHVDPVKNARSTSIDLANGVVSRTEVVNANGGDIEQVVRNRANEAEMIVDAVRQVAGEKGIELSKDAELSLIIDVIATKEVKTPTIEVEEVENE